MHTLTVASLSLQLFSAVQSIAFDFPDWSAAENEIRACVEDGNWSCRSSALAVCMRELDRPTHYWATCLDRERQVWDDLLNEAYRNLVRTIREAPQNDLPEDYPDTRIEALRDAQRAWITLRDLTCEYEADRSLGGTHIMTTIPECLTRETAERLRWLNAQLSGHSPNSGASLNEQPDTSDWSGYPPAESLVMARAFARCSALFDHLEEASHRWTESQGINFDVIAARSNLVARYFAFQVNRDDRFVSEFVESTIDQRRQLIQLIERRGVDVEAEEYPHCRDLMTNLGNDVFNDLASVMNEDLNE